MILRATESVLGEPARWTSSSSSASIRVRSWSRAAGRGGDGVGEAADPVVGASFPEVGEPGDVALGVGCQHHADRGDEAGCDAAPAQDHVDEAASGAAVAVTEGVDGLELGVRDRGLRDGGQVVEVHERDEVVEQARHAIRRWRDERRVAWARASAADPVLLRPHDSGESGFGRALEQRPVDVEHVVESESAARGADLDGALHGADVAEHRACGRVGRDRFVGGEGQSLVRRAEALDERRAERLRAEQRGGDRLEVMAGASGLELAQRGGGARRPRPRRDRPAGGPSSRSDQGRTPGSGTGGGLGGVRSRLPPRCSRRAQPADVPFGRGPVQKERHRSFRNVIVPAEPQLRKEAPRSFRSRGVSTMCRSLRSGPLHRRV